MTGKDWRGSAALVTGASRGIGVHIAEGLAKAGLHLVLVARDVDRLGAVARACEGHGVRVRVRAADLRSPADRRALAEDEVDVLVNNAGLEIPIAVLDHTEADVDAQIATNLVAPIELCRLLVPRMVARGRGVVVNVSSMSGKSPTPFNAIYTATKHGLNGFTASLRLELEGTGVHAGVVCPSFVAEAGMWADWGLRAPALVREVPPARCVEAVLAVLGGAPEVLVTPSPMRPLLALGQLFPRLDGFLLGRLGVIPVLRSRAARALAARSGS